MRRRRELEEESAFFGSMDGASKFVRGDAIAGLIITAVNVFGGIIIGVTRHGMSFSEAADVFTKLSVGDGLVTQIPALIISLAAGLLVSKGGTRGSADKAVFGQLGNHPRALTVAGGRHARARLRAGLPFLPVRSAWAARWGSSPTLFRVATRRRSPPRTRGRARPGSRPRRRCASRSRSRSRPSSWSCASASRSRERCWPRTTSWLSA